MKLDPPHDLDRQAPHFERAGALNITPLAAERAIAPIRRARPVRVLSRTVPRPGHVRAFVGPRRAMMAAGQTSASASAAARSPRQTAQVRRLT